MEKPKRVCMFTADGLEECECLIAADLFRRAGIEVILASIKEDRSIRSSHDIVFFADALAKDLFAADGTLKEGTAPFDLLYLPGGVEGTKNLKESALVLKSLRAHAGEGKPLAAICAAPTVLKECGLIEGKRVTAHPSVKEELESAVYTGEAVTRDGNIFTGKGMGVTIEFAAELISFLIGQEEARSILQAIQYQA